MTIAILKHESDVTEIPRPFNRADNLDEMAEMLAHWLGVWTADKAMTSWITKFTPENLDTDLPVLEVRPASHGHYTGPGLRPAIKFYAFIEE